MATKMTKTEKFAKVKAMLNGFGVTEFDEFLDHEVELISKKNGSRKMTATQKANEEIKTQILDFMQKGQKYLVKDIQKAMGIETNQKASALIRQLRLASLVIRTEEKGQAYFEKA